MSYVVADVLVSSESYFYWSEPTQTYLQYTPSVVSWTDYYAVPSVDLYVFDEVTASYQFVASPSPYVDYVYYEPSVQTYIQYEPITQDWN